MKNLKRNMMLLAMAACTTLSASAAMPDKVEAPVEPEIAKAVRQKLERLNDYGVFDILTYQVDPAGTVQLGGFAFRDSLKKEAEDAVFKVPGVKKVVNKIEDLEWGVQDDEIRAKVYLTIYRDTFLSRYGTSIDIALANGVGYGPRGRFSVFGPVGIGNPFFPGFNPTGDYGIHILVTNGDVILMGEVDNEGDKNLAGIKARGVFPVKKVFNELSVKNAKPENKDQAPELKKGVYVSAASS